MNVHEREVLPVETQILGLRKQLRRLERLVIALSTLLVIGALSGRLYPLLAQGPRKDRRLEAEEILLKDATGRASIVIGFQDETIGSGSHEGPGQFTTGVRARIAFSDRSGKPRAELGIGADGHPSLILSAATGERADLMVEPEAQLNLYSSGAHQVSLVASGEGGSCLRLSSPTADAEADLGAFDAGTVGLRLYQNNRLRVAVGQVSRDAAARWQIQERPTSSLLLLNEEGRVVHSIP